MILGLFILALFFSCLVAMLYDVDCAIEEAEHEALLDRIWDDEAGT